MVTMTSIRSALINKRAATLRTATSPAGNQAATDGFTLIELIVVLTIIGMLTILIPGFMLRDNGSLGLDVATRKITEGLRKVQNSAIFQNQDQLFTLDVEQRQFLPGEAAIPVQIDRNIGLRFVTARQERLSEDMGQIRFFADGSSTGGRIILELKDQLSVIEVDWLIGQISVVADAR